MKTYNTVRIPRMLVILCLIIPVFLFTSCNKIDMSSDEWHSNFKQQDINSKVISSVSGFVTNQTGDAVQGAAVQFGSGMVTTDEYGYFEVTDAEVSGNAAVVTVIKSGYFNGIKTYIAASNESAFFRIKLIPKTNAGSLNAAAGGKITLGNGLSILFPANAIINAGTGAVYNGTVNVAAFWIDPLAGDLDEIMPGDLRGVTTGGDMKKLTSYGMAAVELTDASGNKLQIAPGNKATMTMPVAAEILSYAPASIPLWYFDEAKGLWEEQGSAIKNGNVYVGEVSHFSFWNYDSPDSYVQFNCTALNAAGAPLQNVLIKIYAVNKPNNVSYGFTNAHGYAAGLVPANTVLQLEVMGDVACNTPVYVQTFTSATSNISLAPIRVNASAGMATVSGTLTDCNNNTVSNGGILMQKNNQYYRYATDQKGSYNFTTPLCNTTAVVNLIAYNAAAAQYSIATDHTITTGTNTVIDMKACGVKSQQFINYNIDGVDYSFTYPASAFAPVTPNTHFTFAVTNEMDHSHAGFQFLGTYTGIYNNLPLTYFTASQLPESVTLTDPVLVTITENGADGQIFAGHFSGVFRGAAPGNRTYNISCSFRVKCQL